MYSIQVTGQNDKSHSYLKKDNLSALVDHESNTVRQTVASTSNVPTCVDHVDLGLDLIWMDNVNRTICCRLRDVQGVPENVPSRHVHSGQDTAGSSKGF